MRRFSYQIGTGSGLDEERVQAPFRRRMPTVAHIEREVQRRFKTPAAKPLTFGQRRERPTTVITTTRRFSLAPLTSLFYGPRNTRRTNAR
jgi:hypothetical protein